jgi:hypothetical protein
MNISFYPLSFTEPVLKLKIELSSESAKVGELKPKIKEMLHRYY